MAVDARPKIIAAEIPQHEEGMKRVAPPVALAWLLLIVGLIAAPAPVDEVRHLERARAIIKRAEAHREACRKRPPVIIETRSAAQLQPALPELPVIPLAPLPPERDVRELERAKDELRKIADLASALDIEPMPYLERGPPQPPVAAAKEGEVICRLPARDDVASWFRRHAVPILKSCMDGAASRGSIALTFDGIGRVEDVVVEELSDALVVCATPRLRRLSHPDMAHLTFMFPVVIDPGE